MSHHRISALAALLFLALSVLRTDAALNVTISAAASTGGSFAAGVWTPTASPSRINITDLLVQLNGGNVVINTNAAGAEAGTITIANTIPLDDLTTTASRTLTLNAQDDVLVNAALIQNGVGGNNVANQVTVVMNANLSSGNGDVTVAANVATAGGGITMTGRSLAVNAAVNLESSGGTIIGTFSGTATVSGNFISTAGANFSLTTAGNSSVSAPIFSSGGNINLRSTASAAILTINGILDARFGANTGSVDVLCDLGTLNVTLGEVRTGFGGTARLRSQGALTISGIVGGGALDLNALGGLSDLTIQAGSSITATGAASIIAGNHVNLNAPISADGGLTIQADSNSGGVGDVVAPVSLTTENNPVQITGRNFSQTAGSIDTNGGNLGFTIVGNTDLSGVSVTTVGGTFSVTTGTFSNSCPITTSGGTFTISGGGNATIQNDVTTSGGNLSVTVSGSGAIISNSVGSDLDATGGAGTGSIKLTATNGTVNTTANLRSGSGGIEVVGAASSTLKGTLSCFGGSFVARLTGASALLSFEGTVSTVANNPISLRSLNGGVTVKAGASIVTGGGGSVLIEALGPTDDVTFAGAITGGGGGVTLRSNDAVLIQSLLNVTGSITIAADFGGGGVGDAAISAGVTGANTPIAISGANVIANATIDTNGGNLSLAATSAVDTDGGTLITDGGNVTVNAGSFSLGVIITSGGSITTTATGAGILANDVTTSGGNASFTTGGLLTVPLGTDLDVSGGAGTGAITLRSTGGLVDLSGRLNSGFSTTVLAGATGVNFNASAIVSATSLDVDATGAGNIDIKTGTTISVTNTGSFETANGDVLLSAGANFTPSVSNGLTLTARGAGGDLSIGRPILIDDVNATLTLRADADVLLFASVTTTGGPLVVQADADGDLLGTASLNSNVTTNGGSVTITAAAAAITSPQIVTGGGAISITTSDSHSIGGSFFTSGGNISATATAAGSLLTITGNLDGTGGAGTSSISLRSLAGSVNFASTGRVAAGGGGTATIFGSTGVTLNGDIVAAGNVDVDCVTGNIAIGATATVANSGFFIAFDAANSTITIAAGATITPGGNSLLHLRVATGSNNLTVSQPLTSGLGGIELLSDNDVVVSAALTAIGPIRVESDRNLGGVGAINVSANIQSTGGGDLTFKGRGITLGNLATNGGEVSIDNDGTALTFNGSISTGGGGLTIATASAITYGVGVAFNGGTGFLTYSADNTSLTIPTNITLSNFGAIALVASGAASDITVQRSLVAGTGGITTVAPDQVTIDGSLQTTGAVFLRADSDGIGGGNLVVNASISATNQALTLRGTGVALNANVGTTGGEIGLQPNIGTDATIAAALTGPTRVLTGTARLTTGSIAGPLSVNNGAAFDFDLASRVVSPTAFTHSGATAQTTLRIAGAGAGQFNRIAASGAFTAAGILNITLQGGFTPVAGQSFDVLDFTSFSGAFSSINLPALPANVVWDTSQLSSSGIIRTLTPIELWRQMNFGTTANVGFAADTFDRDADGTANLMEYGLVMNPNSPSTTGTPVRGFVNIAGLNYLTLTFTRPLSATDISYRVQAGNFPTVFSDGSFYSLAGNVPTNAVTTEVSRVTVGPNETIVVRDNTPLTAPGSRFLRLKVTWP